MNASDHLVHALNNALPIPGDYTPIAPPAIGFPEQAPEDNQKPTTVIPEIDPPRCLFPPCYMICLTINRLTVTRAARLGEPLASFSQWSLYISINGALNVWDVGDVNAGSTHTSGHKQCLRIGRGSTITLSVGGANARDPFYDLLPSASDRHGCEDRWGIGRRHELTASDGEYEYTVEYTISCARARTSLIPPNVFMKKMFPGQKIELHIKKHGEYGLVNAGLRRVQRYHMSLKSYTNDMMVFEGPMDINELLEGMMTSDKGVKTSK